MRSAVSKVLEWDELYGEGWSGSSSCIADIMEEYTREQLKDLKGTIISTTMDSIDPVILGNIIVTIDNAIKRLEE